MPLQIVQASNNCPTSHEDFCKLIALSTDASLSHPITRCMLRQPDSYASHKQCVEHFHAIALENAGTRIFMALDSSPHDLGAILGSVLIERCRIGDPIFVFEWRDLDRLGINREIFEHMHTKAEEQRREVMERDYYSTFYRDDGEMSQRRPLILLTIFAD